MVDTISYKSFLTGPESKQRIERFKIDRKVRHSVMFLKEKLYRTYNDLNGKQFKITWRDDDGDDVIINSNESLSIALNEQEGPVYKIYVEVLGEEEKDDKTHPGVQCDGCEQPVVGNRYKCLVCQDYDLCRDCEIKGLHPGHNMVRMTSIEDSIEISQNDNMQNFFQKFNKMKKQTQQNKQKPLRYSRNNSTDNRKRSNTLVPHGAGETRNASKSPRRRNTGSRSASQFKTKNTPPPSNKEHPFLTHGIFHGVQPPNANGGIFPGVVIDGGKNKENTYIGQMVSPQPNRKNTQGTTQTTKPDPFKVRGQEKKVAKGKKQETKKTLIVEIPTKSTINEPPSNKKPKNTDTSPPPISITSQNSRDGPIMVANNGFENPNKQEEEPCEDLGDANQDIPPVLPIAKVREKIKKRIIEKLEKEGKNEDETDYFYSSDEDEWTLMKKNSSSSDTSIELISPPSFNLYPTIPQIDPTPKVEKKTTKKNEENKQKEIKTETKPSYAEVSTANLPPIQKTSNILATPTNNTPPTSNITTTPKNNTSLIQTTSKPRNPTQPISNPATPTNPPVQIAVHPNEKIRIALQAMLNMGYTNEGGWLSNLLVQCNGDIGHVLDVLSPIRRY